MKEDQQSKQIIKKEVPLKKKTVSNVSNKQISDEKENNDVVFLGNGSNNWRLLCKAYSKNEGWMKSTKALQLNASDVLVQVSTQQRNSDGTYCISEAVTTVKGNLHESSTEKGIYFLS